jgi:hypothetical protein
MLVAGNKVRSTGSSLYSRQIMIHMSKPSLAITAGSTVSSLWRSQPSVTLACSLRGRIFLS